MAAFCWAIAGFGWVARDYMAPALLAAGHRLVAVADPSAQARARAAALGAAGYEDVAAMLRETRPDALYVATPNDAHAAPVLAAMQAGVPVLCEKPLAAQWEDAHAMAAAVVQAQAGRGLPGGAAGGALLFGTAYDQRHHPAHEAMRAAITQDLVGTVTALRLVYACWVGPGWSPDGGGGANWRACAQAAGGGAVMDLAPHGLDLAIYLLGEEFAELQVSVQRQVHDYAVEDGGVLTGRLRSGALFSAHVAYNMPETLPRRRLEVVGTRGLLTATDTMGQSAGGVLTFQDARTGETRALPFDSGLSPFQAQAEAFARAVQGGAHDFSLARDLALFRLFHEAYAAARACL